MASAAPHQQHHQDKIEIAGPFDTYRLLALPPELRLHIWHFVAPSDLRLSCNAYTLPSEGNIVATKSAFPISPTTKMHMATDRIAGFDQVSGKALAFLHLNRQIREEASPFLFRSSRLWLQWDHSLIIFLERLPSTMHGKRSEKRSSSFLRDDPSVLSLGIWISSFHHLGFLSRVEIALGWRPLCLANALIYNPEEPPWSAPLLDSSYKSPYASRPVSLRQKPLQSLQVMLLMSLRETSNAVLEDLDKTFETHVVHGVQVAGRFLKAVKGASEWHPGTTLNAEDNATRSTSQLPQGELQSNTCIYSKRWTGEVVVDVEERRLPIEGMYLVSGQSDLAALPPQR